MDIQTIETYNKMAKEYDAETTNFWDEFPRTFFDEFARLAKGKLLDIGSGPGRDALILKEKGLDITCLDASETMLELCKEKGLKTALGDFKKLPFENESFNAVWAYTSLLHIPKIEINEALSEVQRVLTPGGIFGIGMIEGEIEGYRESAGVHMPRWFAFYTKTELEELLTKHGFQILHFEEIKRRTHTYLNFICKK